MDFAPIWVIFKLMKIVTYQAQKARKARKARSPRARVLTTQIGPGGPKPGPDGGNYTY